MKILALVSLVFFVSCNETPDGPDLESYKGVVINEVAAHDETVDAVCWVEILNNSDAPVALDGLGLFLFDEYFEGKNIHEFTSETLEPGGRLLLSTADESLVTGFASTSSFELRLAGTADETAVDTFSNEGLKSLYTNGSYQRIPDGNGEWVSTAAATRSRENLVMGLDNTKPNAIWLWSTHSGEWLENDWEIMKRMKALGYDHVLLNFAAFKYPANQKRTKEFIAAATEVGIMVHAWMQCFYNGGWVNPVDDENNRYKQELFDSIIAEANTYINDFGVQALHLDYIRFPGTAYKHNPSKEITGAGAVTEFCRQLREAMDARGEDIIISAAMMAEDNAIYYYGQNPAQMGEYVDVFMPMIYRYQEGGSAYGAEWCRRMVRLFTTVTDSQVWAGTQTYNYNGSNVRGLSADKLRSDCEDFVGSGAGGIVLFRYALGEFPDLNDLWDNQL